MKRYILIFKQNVTIEVMQKEYDSFEDWLENNYSFIYSSNNIEDIKEIETE